MFDSCTKTKATWRKKMFKWLPDGRKRRAKWGAERAKSDCNGLKRTRGAIEAAQTE